MTPAQCRAGRQLLRWTVRELSDKADVSTTTIVNFENGKTAANSSTTRILQATMERAGVEFAGPGDDDQVAEVVAIHLSDGSSVRLKRAKS